MAIMKHHVNNEYKLQNIKFDLTTQTVQFGGRIIGEQTFIKIFIIRNYFEIKCANLPDTDSHKFQKAQL